MFQVRKQGTKRKVAVRKPKMPREVTWKGSELMAWHAQEKKPVSVYDKLPPKQRPFGWATPAPVAPGKLPVPWRVAHADRAAALVSAMFPGEDAWVEHEDSIRGCKALVIGLRDNRNAAAYKTRLKEMSLALRARGFKTKLDEWDGGRHVSLYLVDDLKHDALTRFREIKPLLIRD